MEVVTPDGARTGPKGTESYVKKWPKHPQSPLLLQCFLPLSRQLWPHGLLPVTADRGREDSGLVYRQFCMIWRYHLSGDSCSATPPPPRRTCWREILPVGRAWAVYLDVHLVWEENGQTSNFILIDVQWPMVWLDGQGFGRNKIRILRTRVSC